MRLISRQVRHREIQSRKHQLLAFAHSQTADGKKLLSWRVYILPFIEANNLFDQFHLDEPWDSEHNKKLIAQMPAVYQAPGSKAGAGKTNYLGIYGKTAFLSDPTNKERMPLGSKIRDFTDGTSNTVSIVEAADSEAVIWTKPDDYTPDPKQPNKGLIGLRKKGFLAALVDGSIRFITDTVPAEVLNNLFNRQDGNPLPDNF